MPASAATSAGVLPSSIRWRTMLRDSHLKDNPFEIGSSALESDASGSGLPGLSPLLKNLPEDTLEFFHLLLRKALREIVLDLL